MPAAHPVTTPDRLSVVTPLEGEPGPGYRGRRRRAASRPDDLELLPDVEVTEPVLLPELVAPRQFQTRAEAKAAARAEQRSRPTTTSGRRPAASANVRRAPQRRVTAPPPPPRRHRGLSVLTALGVVAALGAAAVAADALPSQASSHATSSLAGQAVAGSGLAAADTAHRSTASQQSSASVLAGESDTAFRMVAVSRSQERGPIAGCSGQVPAGHFANGQLPPAVLCSLPFAPPHRLRADAAVRLIRLNEVYKGKFGEDLCLTDSYRSLSSQYSLAGRKPGLAARPGTSEHGWGLAVDVCKGPDQPGSARRAWFLENAPAFGWANPDWALPGGSKPEPWHWEFVEGE